MTGTPPNEAADKPTVVHLKYLDSLRAIAACFVVLHHAFIHVDPQHYAKHGALSSRLAFLMQGHWAVDVFIVLSGFALMIPIVRDGSRILSGGAWRFYARRARRILPPYYGALLLSLLLIRTVIGQPTGTHWDVTLPVDAKSLVTHLLLLQDLVWSSASRINHVLWSISVECRIYLCFPLLVLLWRKFGALPTLVAVLSISAALQYVADHTWRITHINNTADGVNLHYFGLFCLGMFGAQQAFGLKSRPLAVKSGLLALGAFAFASVIVYELLGAFAAQGGVAVPFYVEDIFVGFWTTLTLIGLASAGDGNPVKAFFNSRLLVFIGGFSYSIYLIHAPLIQLIWLYAARPLRLAPQATFLFLVGVGLPLILAASYLFHLAFERPFLSARGRRV